MEKWHALGANEALEKLGTNKDTGLSEQQVRQRLLEHGYNQVIHPKKKSAAEIFLAQFNNVLILMLIAAAILAALLGELLDAGAMLAIVSLSTIFGFVQEFRAEKAIEMLQKLSAPVTTVIRNGTAKNIPAHEIVLGDIILLEAGNIVPADCRVITHISLEVDEASLTGESVPSKKNAVSYPEHTSVADQENMVFAGTVVTYGRGSAVATTIAGKTEFGKIVEFIQKEPETKTPLQKKFEKIAQQLGLVVLALVAVVFFAGIANGSLSMQKMMLFAISLAVAAVPNSLPAIVTISLAIGAQEMARRKMIIRKLSATESLGAITVICTDKTGTITKNEMTVTKVFADLEEFDISGSGYYPVGKFSGLNGKAADAKKFALLSRIGLLCNNSKVAFENGKWKVIGDPTEGALVVLASKAGLEEHAENKKFEAIFELPFDSERKMMTRIVQEQSSGKKYAYVKGAPDILLRACNRITVNGKVRAITSLDRKKILGANSNFSENALRVIAFAYTEKIPKEATAQSTEKDLVFAGLAAMIDPPRDEIFDAIKNAKAAGIKVVLITGDAAGTATAVAKKIGLFKDGDIVLTGEQIEKMSAAQLERDMTKVSVVARTMPIQKSRIVEALRKNGHIVCMTGDGVNDAPALKKADMGISMGITGTDVAKEVSKATIVDDNFATIIAGIMEGRNVYDKIINSTRYLLSCNAGEITIVLLSIIFGMPLPLIPLQILLMNLLTDGLPALGLGFEKSTHEVMQRAPRHPSEKPLSNRLIASIVAFGLLMGIGSFALFVSYLPEGLQKAQSVAFTTLVMFQMFAAVGSRSIYPFRNLNILSNKWLAGGIASSVLIQLLILYWAPLQAVFGTVPLGIWDWAKILAVSSFGFILMEIGKIFLSKEHPQKSGQPQTAVKPVAN